MIITGTIATTVAIAIAKAIAIAGGSIALGAGAIKLVNWAKEEIKESNVEKKEDYLNELDNKLNEEKVISPNEEENKSKEENPNNTTPNINDGVVKQENEEFKNNNEDKNITSGIPNIEDKTNENIEEGITPQTNWKKWWEEQQAKLWEREDAIRKETQEREDTAWQRGIEDMRKAGINPNLINAAPAESGGGITQASQMNTGVVTEDISGAIKEMQTLLEQNFKGDENDKDRWMESLGSLITTVIMAWAIKK